MLFRETTGPLGGALASSDQVPRTKLTIYATGAWDRVDGQGTESLAHDSLISSYQLLAVSQPVGAIADHWRKARPCSA